jgi:glutamyl-tRNA reductase
VSVLVVGLSHRSAPVSLLADAALPAARIPPLLQELVDAEHVAEAVALSTCNRVEVYAAVTKFHGGVSDVSESFARHCGVPLDRLTPHLYVHYEDRAVAHLFSVACGLDSMVVGEGQILGQVRAALRTGQEVGAVGRTLNELAQQALRVGKRAHAETEIDRAGQSLVTVGLQVASDLLGGSDPASALVVGAGSMSALAAATLRRAGVAEIRVSSRTYASAVRLARAVHGQAVPFPDLEEGLVAADIVVSCTGAVEVVVPAARVAAAAARRAHRPQVLLDLALPRDVDPAVQAIPGIALVDLERLAQALARDGDTYDSDVDAVRRIVAEEVATFLGEQRAAQVAPTVAALRSMAADVVDAELARLGARLRGLDAAARREIEQTVRRVVDKLLHAPTVRVKQLAGEPGGDAYADALRELFDLDPAAVEAVIRPDPAPKGGPADG